MSDMVYRPGEWQVVVEESGVAALPADAAVDKVVALAEMLRRGVPELTEVIDVLSGGAITGLGSFAVALIGPTGTRFAVRGAVNVSTGFAESFSGEDITTWSERFLPGPARFEISLGDATEGAAYPIRSGVVLAAGVRVGEEFTPPEPEPAEDSADEDGLIVVPMAEDTLEQEDLAAESSEGPEAPVATDAKPDAVAEPDSDAEPEAEAASDDEEEPNAEPEMAAEPEAEPVPDPELEPEPEPASAPASAADAPTETITPDDLAQLFGSDAEDEVPTDTLAPDDLAATITAEEAPHASSPTPEAPAAGAPASILPPPPGAYPPPPAAGAYPPPSDGGLDIGDHDGATISVAEARRLRAAGTSDPQAPTEVLPAFPAAAEGVSARIRLSTGQVVELDRSVIVGRKPRSTRASGSTLPHLIAVDSPESDISRNHLEVRPEGDSVVVVDLHTTNGSTLLRPGADPVRLHPGEATLVLGGDVIDIGDGVTVTVEELR